MALNLPAGSEVQEIAPVEERVRSEREREREVGRGERGSREDERESRESLVCSSLLRDFLVCLFQFLSALSDVICFFFFSSPFSSVFLWPMEERERDRKYFFCFNGCWS